jgi:hypothetical protein
MGWLKKIYNFYLDANIHVALGVYALVQVTLIEYQLPYDRSISFALFFGTIVEYGFIKYASLAKHYLFLKQQYLRWIQLFNFTCAVIAMYFVSELNMKTVIAAAALVLVAFLYVVPSLTTKKNLRNLKGIKAFVVSLTWSVSTVLLPLLNSDILITSEVFIDLVQRFLFVLALMIPFEIRDLKFDEPNLRTIPQVIGVGGSRLLGVVLLVFFVLFGFLQTNINATSLYVEWGIAFLLLIALLFTRADQSKYYASFFVEGISIVWWIGLLLL